MVKSRRTAQNQVKMKTETEDHSQITQTKIPARVKSHTES
jgi:hypothetical protein